MPDRALAEHKSAKRNKSVFLNLPYDNSYQDLLLAYIAGVTVFNLPPRAALEDPASTRRLDRIGALIQGCAYSIHDLSLIELHLDPKRPRLNMPFELGLSVAQDISCRNHHRWFIFVQDLQSFKGSLSDLDGTDVQIHRGDRAVVFLNLMNIFSNPKANVSVKQMESTYQILKSKLPMVLQNTGASSCFEASVFRQLAATARSWASVFLDGESIRQDLGGKTRARPKRR